jgi:hypothetical protein
VNPSVIAPVLAGKILGTSDNSFAVAEWRAEGGPPGPPRYVAPLHIHHRDDEAWYVLEGVLCVRVGEESVELGPGAGVLVPRGTAHTYWNPGPGPARYLLLMTPTILRLIDGLHALPNRERATVAALFERCYSTLLDFPSGG